MNPRWLIGGILLLLLFWLFASPVCDGIPIVGNMPKSHWLYAISMSLSAYVLFVANPIGFYVSSSDLVGGVNSVAGNLLVLFMATFLVTSRKFLYHLPC